MQFPCYCSWASPIRYIHTDLTFPIPIKASSLPCELRALGLLHLMSIFAEKEERIWGRYHVRGSHITVARWPSQ